MLYVHFGNDVIQVRQKAFSFLESLTDEETLVMQVTTEEYKKGMFADLAEGASLFNTKQVVILDTLSEDRDVFEDLCNNIELLKESNNHFIIIEKALNTAEKKILTKYALSCEEVSGEKKERFSAFSLTDALLRRDKKTLWLLLMEAWREGLSNEEIIGVLLWQVKILRLAEKTSSAEEAGQKPFVYQKAKRALTKFKEGELDTFARTLLSIYHEGHLGKHDTALALEKWALEV